MEVYGYDPYISLDHAWHVSRHIIHATNKEEIYNECDYITLHLPSTDDTEGMINKESIEQMKDGVSILNFARNTLVNDDDIIEALNAGKVSKYVSDFPTPAIANAKNAIAIPHLGASTEESEDNCAMMAVKQLVDYMENGNIKNSVNFPNLDAGVCTTKGRIAILHRNIPKMLTQFTGAFAELDVNIANLVNKSRGNYAYTVIDVDTLVNGDVTSKLSSIDGVLKVRLVK